MVFTEVERLISATKDQADWKFICQTIALSQQFLERHLDYIVWSRLCGNVNIPEQFFTAHLDRLNGKSWEAITNNYSISEDFFEAHIEIINRDHPQLWREIAKHPGVSGDFLERHLAGRYGHRIPWSSIAVNKNLPETFFEKHLSKCIKFIGGNIGLSQAFLERHPECVDWNWIQINPNVTTDFILANIPQQFQGRSLRLFGRFNNEQSLAACPDLIDWWELSRNPLLPEAFFEKIISEGKGDQLWWYVLCCNSAVSEAFLERHIDKICWKYVFSNPNISGEFLERHNYQQQDFDPEALYSNPGIGVSFWQSRLTDDIWHQLSVNPGIPLEFLESSSYCSGPARKLFLHCNKHEESNRRFYRCRYLEGLQYLIDNSSLSSLFRLLR